MHGDDFFQKMCKEAMDEVASGDKGWKDVDSNILILACFGMLTNHLSSRLVRPLWFAASSVFAAAIVYSVKHIIGM